MSGRLADRVALLFAVALVSGDLVLARPSVAGCDAVCGNGVVEPGEHCDGGPYCSRACTPAPPNCCAVADQCHAAPPYITQYLATYCSAFSTPSVTSLPVFGAVCQGDGSCQVQPITPVAACCQHASSCFDRVVSDTYALYYIRAQCYGQGSGPDSGDITFPAPCVAGTCVPQ